MKKILITLLGLFSIAYGQTIGYLRYDTVKIYTTKAGGRGSLDVTGAVKFTGLLQKSAGTDSVIVRDASGFLGTVSKASIAGSGWGLTGNTGIDTSVNWLGTNDANDLVIKTNNARVLTVNTNGALGIGNPADYGTSLYRLKSGGSAGPPVWGTNTISELTGATGSNSINNANYTQEWQWNTLSATGIKFSSTSTGAGASAQKVLEISLSGANASSGQSTYGIYSNNTHTGTTSTNYGGYFAASGGASNNIGVYGSGIGSNSYGVYGATNTGYAVRGAANGGYSFYGVSSGSTGSVTSLYAEASGATVTNIAARFKAANAVNNIALAIENGEGDVGIGTLTPAATLHTVGTVRHASLGSASTDTTTYKPLGVSSLGDVIPMTAWPGVSKTDSSFYVTSGSKINANWWVNVLDYGAVGDGSTNNNTAFANAKATGKTIYIPEDTFVITDLHLLAGQTLVGAGYKSIIKLVNNDYNVWLEMNCTVKNIRFIGTGEDHGYTAQVALFVYNTNGINIENVWFEDIAGKGVYLYNTIIGGASRVGVTMHNVTATNCNIGYSISPDGAEYNRFSSCVAVSCNYGFVVAAGNNKFTNCNSTNNDYGWQFNTGSNAGHCTIVNSQGNHNTYNLDITGEQYSLNFTGCDFQVGAINFTNTHDVMFTGCNLYAETCLVDSSYNIYFNSCNKRYNTVFTVVGGAYSSYSELGVSNVYNGTFTPFYSIPVTTGIDLSGGQYDALQPGLYHIINGDVTNSFNLPDATLFSGRTINIIMKVGNSSPLTATVGDTYDKTGSPISALSGGTYTFTSNGADWWEF